MAVGYNPKVVTSGLKFHIDAANIKSYDANDQGISGEQLFTTTGSTTWSVTTGVTEVSAVVVGGGGGGAASDYNSNTDNEGGCGGGGGGLAYGTFPVTPGETLTIVVGSGGGGGTAPAGAGTNGGASQIKRGSTVLLHGGGGGRGTHGIPGTGGSGGDSSGPQRDGGGTGGAGGEAEDNTRGDGGGGGGAGGYSGNGGAGASPETYVYGSAGSGGAGGGGGGDGTYPKAGAAGGGGVGLEAKGLSGGSGPQGGGKKGSGGSNGGGGSSYTGTAGDGGNYGGGGGGAGSNVADEQPGGDGAPGAVRIVWGFGRKYPEETAPAPASTKIKNITNDSTRTNAIFGKATHTSNGSLSTFDTDGEFAIIKDDNIFTDAALEAKWTLSLWVKFDALGTIHSRHHTLFTHGNNATREGLLLGTKYLSGSNTVLYFSLTSDDLEGNTGISTGTWYNIVYTLNNTTYEKQIYLNGSLDNSHTGGGAYSATTGSNARFFKMLHQTGTGYNNFDGSMGFCSFYDRVLTAVEIKQNFNALRGRYGI